MTKAATLTITNGPTGQLIGRTAPVKNSRMFEGRASADNGQTWLPSVFNGDSRHIIYTGLTPGVEYTCQARALGGSPGQGEWSDPVKHRSL